jgi:vesicular inhibitory amino acid transporter
LDLTAKFFELLFLIWLNIQPSIQSKIQEKLTTEYFILLPNSFSLCGFDNCNQKSYIFKESIINEAGGESTAHAVKGLSLATTAIFIIGEMTGTGILSLPKAVSQSDWTGIGLILGCCVLSAYCGIRLASCWILILSKNESFRQGVRDPFPVIAYEAAGRVGRYIVLVSSYLQLFGAGVIFILLASENVANILNNKFLYFCDWTIIITCLMFPVSMLGTPKDFWPIAVGAMVCTAVACLCIFVQSMDQIVTPLPVNNPITAE